MRASFCAISAASFRVAVAGVLVAAASAAFVSRAEAQSPPTLQQYPLQDRIFGSGGLFSPNYVTPYEYGHGYVITSGIGSKGAIFAAANVDMRCQQLEVPTITVLSAPPGGRVAIQYGTFVPTNIDGGSTFCLGQPVRGMVVRYLGRPRGPQTVSLRVTYPPMGAWYDHVVQVSAR